MNKIKIVLLSAVLALSLCACGPIHTPSESEQRRIDTATQIATGKVIDCLNEFAHPEVVGMDYTEMTYNELSVNAANMYGGTSTAMELNGEIISNPRNGNFQAKTRPVPNAWIVVE